MAVKIRQSEDYLHSDVILNKISEYDIFRHYCPQFETLGKKFCSPLRNDSSPTVSIISWNGKLLYKDFGRPEHSFDCFSFLKCKFQCDFYTALRIIDVDFQLGLGSKTEIKPTMEHKAIKYNKKIELKKVIIIKKKRRDWNRHDAQYWKQFNISKKTLIKFNVEPINYYWINENRFTCNSITYSYKINNKYKIYAPLEKDRKWFSNTTIKQVQGWEQLPDISDSLIITSSLKDVMCLHELGYNAVAFQSEMQIPSQKIIDELKSRFTNVFLFYDNDFDKVENPGQSMASKIKKEYDLMNIFIPEQYNAKDVSDLTLSLNIIQIKNLLKQWLNDAKKEQTEK